METQYLVCIHMYVSMYVRMYMHTLQGQRSCCWYPEGGEEEAVLGGEYYFRCIQMAAVEIHSYVRTYVHSYVRTYVHTYVRTYERTYV